MTAMYRLGAVTLLGMSLVLGACSSSDDAASSVDDAVSLAQEATGQELSPLQQEFVNDFVSVLTDASVAELMETAATICVVEFADDQVPKLSGHMGSSASREQADFGKCLATEVCDRAGQEMLIDEGIVRDMAECNEYLYLRYLDGLAGRP